LVAVEVAPGHSSPAITEVGRILESQFGYDSQRVWRFSADQTVPEWLTLETSGRLRALPPAGTAVSGLEFRVQGVSPTSASNGIFAVVRLASVDVTQTLLVNNNVGGEQIPLQQLRREGDGLVGAVTWEKLPNLFPGMDTRGVLPGRCVCGERIPEGAP
jgi:hypothetical protein